MDQSLPERDGQMSNTLEEEKMEITLTMQQENLTVTSGSASKVTETQEETGAGHESAATNSAWKINYSEDEDSEDTDSDSSSSSSSSTSSSSSSSSAPPVIEDDDEGFSQPAPIKTREEVLLEELPAAEEVFVTLPEEAELQPVGTVSSILHQLVIIQSLKDTPPLKDDSILFTSDRVAVGKVFEVFGPVANPLYILHFNSEEQINSKGLTEGMLLYYAPSIKEYTGYILTQQLTIAKGSDASWKNDEEPPEEALDYSDDEKEQNARRKGKNTKKTESSNTGKSACVGQKPLKQQSNKERGFPQKHAGSRVPHPDPRNLHCSYTDSYPPPGHTMYPTYLHTSCPYPPPPPPPPPCFPLYSSPPPPPSFFNPAFSYPLWPPNSVPFSNFPFPPPPPPPPPSSPPH